MSLELLILFAFAMVAATLGHVGVATSDVANLVAAGCLAAFLLAIRFRGVRKPVV